MANNVRTRARQFQYQQFLTGKGRLLLWEGIRGIWKNRKPDPIKELNKIRREWERKLPALRPR